MSSWISATKCKDIKAKIAIDRRIYHAELGNFGDHEPCRKRIWDLRIDVGPGYCQQQPKSDPLFSPEQVLI